jgi:hypothetical protein
MARKYIGNSAGARMSVVSVNPLFCLLRIKERKKEQTRKGFSSFQAHIQSLK